MHNLRAGKGSKVAKKRPFLAFESWKNIFLYMRIC